MDCKTAQRLLEVCRPAGDDFAGPELASATAHLEECPDCLSQFRTHQAFDARVAAAVQAVPVAAGLCHRIHARLDRVATRRRYLRVAVWSTAAAALVLLSAGILQWSRHVDHETPIDKASLAQLEAFDDYDFDEIRQLKLLRADSPAIAAECAELLSQLDVSVRWPQELRLNGLYAVGRTKFFGPPIAVFRFRDPRGECDILAFPHSQFAITGLQTGTQLIGPPTRNIVLIAWTEEDTTYAAVLKDWSPRDWKPLVERSGRLM
jgi:hypothetical protein